MKYFGTDGIRQSADKFTPEFIMAIIRGLVNYAGDQIKVLIGGDTRESTEWILADLETALETFGVEYSSVDVLPTPAINYCFAKMGFDFAIDVTASHNPYTDNGIKIFELDSAGNGTKLCESGREIIEKSLENISEITPAAPSIRESLHDDAVDIYKTHLLDYTDRPNLSSLHIGMDCANGATSVINKTVFEELGAQIELINSDASFDTKINDGCGSTHLEELQALVQEYHLDFGIAFDGDGDRVLMIDENGNVVDGDQVIVILANYLNLRSAAVTVMANQGILNWAKDNDITLEITAVGDSNVAAAMREKSLAIGGEQSGHTILPGEATGDGMLTALMVAKAVVESHKTLGELASAMVKYPQVNLTLPATKEQKQSLKTSKPAKALLLEYAKKLEPLSGRLLVRPSGTENLIRITMWGDDESQITTLAEELKTKLGETL